MEGRGRADVKRLKRALFIELNSKGDRAWQEYWSCLRDFFAGNRSKAELDAVIFNVFGSNSKSVKLHNQFIGAIANNAHFGKLPRSCRRSIQKCLRPPPTVSSDVPCNDEMITEEIPNLLELSQIANEARRREEEKAAEAAAAAAAAAIEKEKKRLEAEIQRAEQKRRVAEEERRRAEEAAAAAMAAKKSLEMQRLRKAQHPNCSSALQQLLRLSTSTPARKRQRLATTAVRHILLPPPPPCHHSTHHTH